MGRFRFPDTSDTTESVINVLQSSLQTWADLVDRRLGSLENMTAPQPAIPKVSGGGGGGSGGGGTGGTYRPTTFVDSGDNPWATPELAYDSNTSTAGTGTAIFDPVGMSNLNAQGTWQGWQNTTLSYDATLNILYDITMYQKGRVSISINGANVYSVTNKNVAQTTLTYMVPKGTNLSTLSVEVTCTVLPPIPSHYATTVCDVYEIWVK